MHRSARHWIAGLLLALQSISTALADPAITEKEAKYFEDCKRLAETGVSAAQHLLGMLYFGGKGVEKNPAEGVKWYRRAAEQGLAKAQFNLGVCYATGDGVARDDSEAVKWYLKAAEQGDIQAQVNLGARYESGYGIEVDVTKAMGWYRKAADMGSAKAQFNLGVIYQKFFEHESKREDLISDKERANRYQVISNMKSELESLGRRAQDPILSDLGRQILGEELQKKEAVFKHAHSEYLAYVEEVKSMRRSKGREDTQALTWFLKAADQGMADAQFRVGLFLQKGWGKPKDPVQAVSWYLKAANQGQKDAQLYLAACLENGEGVARDEIEAYAYYNLAGITNEQARALLSNLEKRMTPEARLLGQDRTKQLQREIEGKLDTIEDLRKAVEREKQLKGA